MRKSGWPIVPRHADRLGALRTAEHNFSFLHFYDLDVTTISALAAEVGGAFAAYTSEQLAEAQKLARQCDLGADIKPVPDGGQPRRGST